MLLLLDGCRRSHTYVAGGKSANKFADVVERFEVPAEVEHLLLCGGRQPPLGRAVELRGHFVVGVIGF